MAKQRTLDGRKKAIWCIWHWYMCWRWWPLWPRYIRSCMSSRFPLAIPRRCTGAKCICFPRTLPWQATKQVLNQPDLWLKYGNTILYTVAGTLFNIVATTLAAYPLSRHALLRAPLFEFLYHVHDVFFRRHDPHLFVGDQSGAVQFPLVMIIPSLLSTYNVMVCRSAFSGIPEE